MISLGIYGFSADAASLASTTSFRQYLVTLELLSRFVLIAVALHFFSAPTPDRLIKRLLIVIVSFEILFGFLSGFKSAVALPVVIVGICYYYCTNKLSIKQISAAIILLLLAYAVIEPFRIARHSDRGFTGTSLRSITNTLIIAATAAIGPASDRPSEAEISSPLAILARTSMTYIASLGVDYEDSGKHSRNAPEFLKDIFLSPLYAVIPRVLWEGKETSRHGQWYLQEVMGETENTTSAVGMSPITYLYFAGNWLAVCLGFLLVGIFQRILALTLMENGGVVYLMMLPIIIVIDSVYYVFILESIRLVPILLMFFLLVYKRTDIHEVKGNVWSQN
jgi:hypothetical protein